MSAPCQWTFCMVCADQVDTAHDQRPGGDVQFAHCIDNSDLCICEDTGLGYVTVLTVSGTFSSSYSHAVRPLGAAS